MLRYQLNPHFLFNTLNAISTLILDNQNRTANQAVMRLSEFLRYTLDQDPMKKVTLRQEIEAMNLYLTTEKLRFGDRLRLEFAVEERALEALVPSLLLQPLIENAVKYAVSPSERGGTIRVEGRARGSMLELAVADDGPGLNTGAAPGAGRGVGLRNTRERLAVLYDDRHRFADARQQARPAHRTRTCRWKWHRPEPHERHRKLRTLLVDDEALSRRGLELRLRMAADIEIVGAVHATAARRWPPYATLKPDLVFLDIQMPGLSGLRRARRAAAARTADDRVRDRLRPLRGAGLRGARHRLRAQARRRRAASPPRSRMCASWSNSAPRWRERNQLVNLLAELRGSGEIEAKPAFAMHTADAELAADPQRPRNRARARRGDRVGGRGRRLPMHPRLAATRTSCAPPCARWSTLLDPRLFQRVHRSTIVNLTRVKSLRAHMNGEYFLRLEGGQELKLSRTYRDKVEYFLKRPRPLVECRPSRSAWRVTGRQWQRRRAAPPLPACRRWTRIRTFVHPHDRECLRRGRRRRAAFGA